MQENRIDGGIAGACLRDAVPTRSTVRGLGLCDVLSVELEPCQIAGAIEHLEERREPLNEAFEQARTRWDAIAESERASMRELEHELSKSAYALRILTMLRGQLPTPHHPDPIMLVGPASMVSGMIAAAARNAVDDLGELIRESPKIDQEAHARLRAAVAAVAAWVETYVDCEAMEWFTFDAPYDPLDPAV